MTSAAERIAVVVPTWREASTIAGCLDALMAQGPDEVVVADAGSPDGTADLARSRGVAVVEAARGRGAQQNAGARATRAEVILFLHADCRLGAEALDDLRRSLLRQPRAAAGCLRMRVEDRDWRFRPIEAAAHIRAGVLGVPYGDQAIWARRWAFEAVGGFPETQLMEDVLISLRLRKYGRIVLLPAAVWVSSRRWRRQGLIRQSLRNWGLTALAALGVPPDRLAGLYPVVR